MTQIELEREVANRTGESLRTVHRRGFNLVEPDYPPPQVVDWDKLDRVRYGADTDARRQGQH